MSDLISIIYASVHSVEKLCQTHNSYNQGHYKLCHDMPVQLLENCLFKDRDRYRDGNGDHTNDLP